jgi:hypothetical protein
MVTNMGSGGGGGSGRSAALEHLETCTQVGCQRCAELVSIEGRVGERGGVGGVVHAVVLDSVHLSPDAATRLRERIEAALEAFDDAFRNTRTHSGCLDSFGPCGDDCFDHGARDGLREALRILTEP